jgi:hypothetical protein
MKQATWDIEMDEMSKEEKLKERQRRNDNFKKIVNNEDLLQVITSMSKKLNYYKKRDIILTTLTTNIEMVVKRYKDKDIKPPYYEMFMKLDNQIKEEMKGLKK